MHGENSQIEFTSLALELIKIINADADIILMGEQPSFCDGCSGGAMKKVFKSPSAYRIGQLLETLRKRGHIEYPAKK